MLSWRNAFNLNRKTPITAIDTYYHSDVNGLKFYMIVGDEIGIVRIQDISAIITQTHTAPITPVDTSYKKRNPYRVIELKDRAQDL